MSLRPRPSSSLNFFRAAKVRDEKIYQRGRRVRGEERRTLMTEAENLVGEPGVDCAIQLVEFAGKEMIGSFADHKTIFTWKRRDERFDLFDGPVLVVASMHKQLGLVALAQKQEIGAVDGNAQAD